MSLMCHIRASWRYEFVEAYRRRLAYALAFEASILAGSRAPYTERLPALVVERSGVLNLSIEGMMLVGAMTAFAVASFASSATVGLLAGIAAADG